MRKSNFQKNMEAIIFIEIIILVVIIVFQVYKLLFILVIRLIKFIYKKILKPIFIKPRTYVKRRHNERQRIQRTKVRDDVWY